MVPILYIYYKHHIYYNILSAFCKKPLIVKIETLEINVLNISHFPMFLTLLSFPLKKMNH